MILPLNKNLFKLKVHTKNADYKRKEKGEKICHILYLSIVTNELISITNEQYKILLKDIIESLPQEYILLNPLLGRKYFLF